MKIKIANKFIGKNQPVFIVAEAGVNHNGKLELAKKLIDIANDCSADAVKFQTWITENIITAEAPKAAYQRKTAKEKTQYDMLKKLELSFNNFRKLKKYADKKGVIFLSTPDDEESVDFLYKQGVPAFKIGSGELTNDIMLEKIAKKGLPIILSTGMSTLEEVKHAVSIIKKYNKQLILLHCTSNYPAKIKDVNLRAMLTLKEEFSVPVGYSDHTLGIDVSVAAVALGAVVIEKHFTLDKSLPGPDHRASLEPKELGEMVKEIRRIEKLSDKEKRKELSSIKNINKILGSSIKKPTKSELPIIKVTRKSLVVAKDIKKGTIITKDLLVMKRPGTGIQPKDTSNVIGKKTVKNIKKDEMITFDMIK